MKIDATLAATIAAVLDEGTLDAAARRLHITPSAVSQRVRALEEQLGRVLLVRSRPVRATEAGEVVVRLARQLDVLEHDALARFGLDDGSAHADDDRARTTVIPLAVNADSMATWFLAPLARLAETHPLAFDLHRDDQDFTAGLLESGTVMAAVTSQREPVAGCSSTPLGVLRYEACATAAFRDRWMPEGVTATALARAPFVDFDRRDGLQHDWLRGQGIDPGGVPRHYVPASHDFASAVRLGLGWGMLPTLQSATARGDGALVALGGVSIDVALYWQQWNLRSALLDDIAAEVAAEAAAVLLPPTLAVSRR